MNENTRTVRLVWMAIVLLLLWAGAGGAQTAAREPVGPEQQIAPAGPTAGDQPNLEKADRLVGLKVRDSRSTWLGTIREIVLTPDRRAVDYVVLSYGGVWGVPEKLFAIPWAQVQPGLGPEALTLNLDRRQLEQEKGLSRDYWPATTAGRWRDRARRPDGAPAAPAVAWSPHAVERDGVVVLPAEELRYRRLDRLAGMTVRNHQGEPLGQLANFVIDARNGALAYAVLTLPYERPSLETRLVAVPWPAVEILPQAGIARLDADRPTLAALAFTASDFPNLADAGYSRQLHDRFHATPYGQVLGYVPDPEPRRTP